ncbi:calcium-binding protein [Aestuariicoccus sp. MJ-SS9]|uniref:calcium-binding protein n=1 Tax=Aestuariicoccus sp. MJ-SS9 TaxID=3079855 RepID=UPI00291394DF|nr:calcium-binding protein [Aestuariicoccus sp. MJ-SS9]MDU8910024.1 calcium-binding protein [Aestuariicoccus sp. MJ-SS9]
MAPDFQNILVELGSGVYSVAFPTRPDAPQDITITDSDGAIIVPPEEDRAQLLQIYEYLFSIGSGTNLQTNLSEAQGTVFSLTYVEAVQEAIHNDLLYLSQQLDAETLEEAAQNIIPFGEFVFGVAWGATLKAVFGRLPGPLEDVAAALGNVIGLNAALEPLTDHIGDYSAYVALSAARDAAGTLSQVRAELIASLHNIQGIGLEDPTPVTVEDFVQIEEHFAHLNFLQQQVGTLLNYASFMVESVPFDLSLGEDNPVFDFLFRPLTVEEKIGLVPVIGDLVDIATIIIDLANTAAAYADASEAMQLLQDYDFASLVANAQTSSYFASEAFETAIDRVAGVAVTGTEESDTVFGAAGDMTFNGLAGDDTVYVNSDDSFALGHDTINGGEGEDVVAIHGAAFDPDRLSDQRPGGGFLYEIDADNSVLLNGVERLDFVTTGESIPLDVEAGLFAVGDSVGLIEVLSSSVYDTLNPDHTGDNLTVDAAGHLASAGEGFASFINSGGYYGGGSSLRVISTDADDGAPVRSELWLGDYAWNVDPDAFDHVPGYGEVALTGAYAFTPGGGNTLISGALVMLDLEPGLEDFDGVTWQSDVPLGMADWNYGDLVASDPLIGSSDPSVIYSRGFYALPGQPLDSAAHGGTLTALTRYVEQETFAVGQRLLNVALPPSDSAPYQHLVFLDGAIWLDAIAYNEDGQLFGAGRPADAPGTPQALYHIDSGTGGMTELGPLPAGVNDLVLTGSAEELTELLGSVAVDPDAPDPFEGTAEPDSIQGTEAGDIIAGQGGDDTIDSGAGDDLVQGGDGDDLLSSGEGNDSLLGQDGDDTLSGGDGSDNIAASAGNDVVSGGPGGDLIGGGPGNDSMTGDGGDDFMGGGQDDDTMDGGAGDDVVNGGPGNDLLSGGDGADTLGASFHDDTVNGGAGDDSLGGGAGSDLLSGDGGSDSIGGGEGNDTISGGDGNDFLAGGGRNDMIAGNAGNDTLNGGDGDDTLSGGAGADVFVFNAFRDGDADVITDFEDGPDRLRLTGVENAPGSGLAGKFAALDITGTAQGALIEYQGHSILLEGVSAGDLGLDDFVFL